MPLLPSVGNARTARGVRAGGAWVGGGGVGGGGIILLCLSVGKAGTARGVVVGWGTSYSCFCVFEKLGPY